MIDGMYIRNPIFGGIGNGTRLNKFAIREFESAISLALDPILNGDPASELSHKKYDNKHNMMNIFFILY